MVEDVNQQNSYTTGKEHEMAQHFRENDTIVSWKVNTHTHITHQSRLWILTQET